MQNDCNSFSNKLYYARSFICELEAETCDKKRASLCDVGELARRVKLFFILGKRTVLVFSEVENYLNSHLIRTDIAS